MFNLSGATVSENESFSLFSVEEDQVMDPIVPEVESHFPSTPQLPQESVIQRVEGLANNDRQNTKHFNFAQIISNPENQEEILANQLAVKEEEVEAMEVEYSKCQAHNFVQKNVDIEDDDMEVDETQPVPKNRFDYRRLLLNDNSTSSSARSSLSEESETGKGKAESSETSSTTSDKLQHQYDKSDERLLIEKSDDEKSEPKCHVVTTELYPKQTTRFTLQLSGDTSEKALESPNGQMKDLQKSPREELIKPIAAKTDFTLRTFGPQPYTRKDVGGPSQPIVQFEMESEDCIVDLRRSFGGFRTSSGRFSQTTTQDEVKSRLDESSRTDKEEAMDYYDEGEAKSFSLPHIQTESEVDGRKSAQGIPEVEKKLSFAEPNLTKVPSDGVISKGKKLSTFSLHSAGESDTSNIGVSEELPLQRRNSIHNVPYVDVNDPATRERMERYKEERRSMLRAKYRVEDYREKPPVSPTSKGTSLSSPEGKKLSDEITSPARKSLDNGVEKTSPNLSRYRKLSTSSVEKNVEKNIEKNIEKNVEKNVEKILLEKSPKIERNSAIDKKQVELKPASLRKMPIEKTALSSPKSNTIYKAENFSKQAENTEAPIRKWSSNSRTSLNSFDNKKVSVSIIEPEVTLRKLATLKNDVIIPPTPQKPVPTVIPTHPEPLDANSAKPSSRSKLTSRSSCPTGLVEDDVNVRERAAIFNSAAAHRANQAELRTKFVSLVPTTQTQTQNSEETKNNSRKNNSVGKMGGPGSPSKIKNIAALFEQKT